MVAYKGILSLSRTFLISLFGCCLFFLINNVNYVISSNFQQQTQQHDEYYYTRTRDHPKHLRISEELKNQYVDDVKYESRINGTKFEYYRSNLARSTMGYDELVYETIHKVFQHRLSPFYIHHYDNDDDKRRSADPTLVSQEACARDLLYLTEKILRVGVVSSGNPASERTNNNNNFSYYYAHLDHHQPDHMTPELTAFFDSYARQEAGLLMGNTYWVGAYDQCVNRHIFELIDTRQPQTRYNQHDTSSPPPSSHQSDDLSISNSQQQVAISFKGRYCVSALKAPTWDALINEKKSKSKDYFKSKRQLAEYSKLFRLQVGVCLPDSCDSTALERHHDEIKLLTSAHLDARFANYDLIDLYCLPDETSPLRQWSGSALNFILFTGAWLTLVLLATLADILDLFVCWPDDELNEKPIVKRSRLGQLVNWLSLRANYRKIMQVNEEIISSSAKQVVVDGTRKGKESKNETGAEKRNASGEQHMELHVSLRFLNAFKVLVMFWIINGHIMLLMIQTAKNILDSDALLNGLMHFLIGATFGVDLFFTMTGFLTSYLIFNSGHAFRMKPVTWIYLSFHRYWRLAPMYLLSFWFSRSVIQLLGSGPLWDYGTSSITFRGLCNTESWWYPLTLTSNLHGLFDECMITSWYISCDMQFWLVSPLFIYLLARQPVSGWLAALATICASSKVRYDSILNDKSARYDELVQPRADIFMRVSHDLPALYTHPHFRISAYLVGLLAGHYVYMIKSGKWTSKLTLDLEQQQQVGNTWRRVSHGKSNSPKLVDQDTTTTTTVATATSKQKVCGKKVFETFFNEPKYGYDATMKTNTETNNVQINNTNNKTHAKNSTAKVQFKAHNQTSKAVICNNHSKQSGHCNCQLAASRRMRNLLAYSGLFMFLLMAFVSYLLSHYFPSAWLKYSKSLAALAYSVDHLIMSIGASFVIVSMCMGQWAPLVRLLSHPNWTRLSKINYALLLLQCEAIYFQIFRYEQVPMAGTRELINILFNLLVTLYPLAFLVTIVFEFPLANIEKLLISSGKQNKE